MLQPVITNIIRFRGYNGDFVPSHPSDDNPWHFAYQVVRRDYASAISFNEFDIVPPVDARGNFEHDQWTFDKIYSIVKEGESFIQKIE